MSVFEHINRIILNRDDAREIGEILGYPPAYLSSHQLVIVIRGDPTLAFVSASNQLVRRKILMCPDEVITLDENNMRDRRGAYYTLDANGEFKAYRTFLTHSHPLRISRTEWAKLKTNLGEIEKQLWPAIIPYIKTLNSPKSG